MKDKWYGEFRIKVTGIRRKWYWYIYMDTKKTPLVRGTVHYNKELAFWAAAAYLRRMVRTRMRNDILLLERLDK